jgi:hypothetical protein
VDIAILVMCACNLFVSVIIIYAVLTVGWAIVRRDEQPQKPELPKKEVSEAEKVRIEREAKRKEEEWNNFFRYTGETQTKRGGN